MKKKTKRKNPADLTKRNNDARKKEIKQIKNEIKTVWKVIETLMADIGGIFKTLSE